MNRTLPALLVGASLLTFVAVPAAAARPTPVVHPAGVGRSVARLAASGAQALTADMPTPGVPLQQLLGYAFGTANQDVTGTLKLAIDKINGLAARPDLLLHTGDITQSSKAAEFDTAQQVIRGAKAD